MNELSIFIDESGDFGKYDYRSPYYIISMVIHNQTSDISQDLQKLNNDLFKLEKENYDPTLVIDWPLSTEGKEYFEKFNRYVFEESQIEDALGKCEQAPGLYNILLAHNPVYFKQYAAWGADLTLSGHLHGGIIRLPFIGGVITPQAKLFPKYDRGIFEKDGKYLVVSAGLGEHTVPVRIFNPPQLICIEIKGTGEDGVISKD